MAIIFEMWVECENEGDAELQRRHFEGLSFTLTSGLEVPWAASFERIPSGHLGVSVWSRHLSARGVRTVQDALDMTEAGLRLYHRLLSAPEFLFARVAIEASILPSSELSDYFVAQYDGTNTCSLHCVLHERLARQFGPLAFFREFRPGCVWNGYYGEDYRPLGSGDHPELLHLKQHLLPDHL